MKKNKMRLKGQLRMYMHWPLIMTILLLAMNIWMYMVDKKAGMMMSVFIIIYFVIAGVLYFYNRSLILADLIQFSTQGDSDDIASGAGAPLLDCAGGWEDSLEERQLFESVGGAQEGALLIQNHTGAQPGSFSEG